MLSSKDARRQIAKLQRKYPVLKVHTEAIFYECYLEAREVASDETGLPLEVFPLECIYNLKQTLALDFFPPEVKDWEGEEH